MYEVIRKGTMPTSSVSYGDAHRPWSRIRTLDGMKNEIKANNADIKLFEKQLKEAVEGNEKQKLRELIAKRKKRNKFLEAEIKEKTERQEKYKRIGDRIKARVSIFGGIDHYNGIGYYTTTPVGQTIHQIDPEADNGLAGVLDDAKGWYSALSTMHKVLFVGALYAAIGGGVVLYRRRRKTIKRNCSCQDK
jgi:hypothetical protein